jgi:phosphoglycolate phosphatase
MVISEKIQTIIWDWNGTLLNDTDLCVEIINGLLARRNLPLLNPEKYREVFSFPVKDYYEEIGFDFCKEPFEIPAKEFIDVYNEEVVHCKLHQGGTEVLRYFQKRGKQQIILSAMEQPVLESTLRQHQIMGYFSLVSGLDNHYAASKIDNGKALMSSLNLNPAEVCLIGDTTHDFEVSQYLGCECILVADGHQSERRLRVTGSKILKQLSELRELNVPN